MKSVKFHYLFFVILALTINAQNKQNNHWIIPSNNDVVFIPDIFLGAISPITNEIAPAYNYIYVEGVASVSDRLGNLLFFTNGEDLWDANTNLITTSAQLKGYRSSTQNIVIIPRPNHYGHYYIVTNDGSTGSTYYGLHYSEVLVNNGAVSFVGTMNIPLKDNSFPAVDIDNNYQNWSEAITTTVHSNGTDYWLLAHVRAVGTPGNIFSYLVTENGITLTPASANDEANVTDPGPFPYGYASSLKVSPDGSSVALASRNGVFVGTFDRSTGIVDMETTAIPGTVNKVGNYSLEFSHANILYFTSGTNSVRTINRVSQPYLTSTVTSNLSQTFGLQRAIDGKIYGSIYDASSLAVIDNPEDTGGTIYTSTLPVMHSVKFGLPQWVYKQSEEGGDCEMFLVDNDDVPAGFQLVQEERMQYIQATNKVDGNARLIYHAGNFIELLPDVSPFITSDTGFEAVYGSQFKAEILACGAPRPFEYKNARATASLIKGISEFDKPDIVTMFPNPGNSKVVVACRDNLKLVIFTSMEGKTVSTQSVSSQMDEVDVTGLANGLYLVTVETHSGQLLQTKFIKN